MAFGFARSRFNTCELCFLAVITWTYVSCLNLPSGFYVAQYGSSHNFTCPGDATENYTFIFLKVDANSKKTYIRTDKPTLTIAKIKRDDYGTYSCEVRNQTGHLIDSKIFGLLFTVPAKTYSFKMFPEIASNPVDEGARFEFKCEYGKPKTKITWWKLDETDQNKRTEIPREKISVKSDNKSIESYVFRKVTQKDSGSYQCEVTENGKPKLTSPHALQVIKNTKPIIQDIKEVFIVEERVMNFKVYLDIFGSPFPNVTFLIEGKEIISCPGKNLTDLMYNVYPCKRDNFEISIHPALIITKVYYPVHDGKYSCVATNNAGSANVTFTVKVTVPPTIYTKDSATIYAEEKTQANVTCFVKRANPKPTIKWYSQGLLDINDVPKDKWNPSNLPKTSIASAGGMYKSTLRIPSNQGKSFYMCNATNSVGVDSRNYKFLRFAKGHDPVVVTPTKPVVRNEGETFVAMCSVTISITENIVFHNEKAGKVVSNETRTMLTLRKGITFRNLTLTITNLTVNDSGIYRCVAGKVLNNAIVNITVKALRPTTISSLRNKTVTEYPKTGSVSLFCNISGNPLPKVTWYKNGRTSVKPNNLDVNNCNKIQHGYYRIKDSPYKLVICKPRGSYTGFYTCFAKNRLGNASIKAYLDVLSPPIIQSPSLLQHKEIGKGMSFEIICNAIGNPTPMVQWIKIGEKDSPATNKSTHVSTLVINSMDESNEGNYSCNASNGVEERGKRLLELKMLLDVVPTPLNQNGVATGMIIGIVVGVILFVVLVAVLCVVWQRSQQKKLLFYKHQYFLKSGEYLVDPSRTLNEQSLNLTYDSDWEFPVERLALGDRLGAGAFGEVFKAEAVGILALNARDKSGIANKRRSKLRRSLRASQRPKKRNSPQGDINATVAVKTVKATATESEIRDLASELKLMIHLGQHNNIVNLLGACTTGRKLYVILEFCPHGNLLSFLRSKRDIYNNTWVKEVFDPEKEFTLIDLVGAALQVSKGMEFLAEKKLIHRDVAARNILVGEKYVMKISDFGLARDIYKDDVYVKTSSGLLPVKWMAIESLFDRVYTHQSDVWSFGVLLWEMMTLGGTPYPGLPPEQLLDYLHNGSRMPQPAKCPLEVYTIMRDCWREEPEQRPTFSGLVEHLGRMLERHMAKDNPYLQIEASPEEIAAAKENDLLLQPKSDYYLLPLLLSNKLQGYDPNAPLPVTPDHSTPTYAGKTEPGLDSEASNLKNTRSYELLREDDKAVGENAHPLRVSIDNESGIGLEDITGKNSNEKNEEDVKHVETVV